MNEFVGLRKTVLCADGRLIFSHDGFSPFDVKESCVWFYDCQESYMSVLTFV